MVGRISSSSGVYYKVTYLLQINADEIAEVDYTRAFSRRGSIDQDYDSVQESEDDGSSGGIESD
jgi:hypothetical protein